VIARDDLLIAMSNSGENGELLIIVPLVKRQGARLIAVTGNPQSSLAKEADVHLDASVREEACPLNLAPPPVRRRRWHWAMRWPWRCWMPRFRGGRLRPLHPAARSAAAC